MKSGPVAQFSPIPSKSNGASAVSAAPISLPTSICPVVSSVTVQKIGSAIPSSRQASLQAMIAAFPCSKS